MCNDFFSVEKKNSKFHIVFYSENLNKLADDENNGKMKRKKKTQRLCQNGNAHKKKVACLEQKRVHSRKYS